jgi:hypothetical protein
MAFIAKDLSVLAYANGFTLWHYASADADTVVRAAGYFSSASHMLRIGDMILANLATATTPVSGILLVNQNTAGAVDTADLSVLGGTDTD